jgi:hypothetical protein
VLTSVTAFFFPSTSFGPAHVVGVLSLVVLAAAIVALYFFRLAGPWRWIYIVGAVLALYVFVAVVQAFQKLPPLATLAPTQSEPPFLIAQLVVNGDLHRSGRRGGKAVSRLAFEYQSPSGLHRSSSKTARPRPTGGSDRCLTAIRPSGARTRIFRTRHRREGHRGVQGDRHRHVHEFRQRRARGARIALWQ